MRKEKTMSQNEKEISSEKTPACLIDALANIDDYIFKTTGEKPAPEDVAGALSKYFVLKEILEFVQLSRQQRLEDQS
jgi:hypothetical protein